MTYLAVPFPEDFSNLATVLKKSLAALKSQIKAGENQINSGDRH